MVVQEPQWRKELTEMMNHSYLLRILADERRLELLREAETQRLVRQTTAIHSDHVSPLRRVTLAVHELLRLHDSPKAEHGSIHKETLFANGGHR